MHISSIVASDVKGIKYTEIQELKMSFRFSNQSNPLCYQRDETLETDLI